MHHGFSLVCISVALSACEDKHVDAYRHDIMPTPPAEHRQRLDLLRKAESFHCNFPGGSFGDWLLVGGPTSHLDTTGLGGFSITEIRTDIGTARILYPEGAQGTHLSTTDLGLHFIDALPAGGIEVLTIYADPAPGVSHSDFAAAWSGHNSLSQGVPFPQQYYGTCTPI